MKCERAEQMLYRSGFIPMNIGIPRTLWNKFTISQGRMSDDIASALIEQEICK